MKAAREAARLGYQRVRTFKAGIQGWVAAGFDLDTSQAVPQCTIPAINAIELNNIKEGVLLLDIRCNLEVQEMGAFPQSQHIPFDELHERLPDMPKNAPIVIVDFSGVEYAAAGSYLKGQGFQDIKGLQGGIQDWIKQGYALEPSDLQ